MKDSIIELLSVMTNSGGTVEVESGVLSSGGGSAPSSPGVGLFGSGPKVKGRNNSGFSSNRKLSSAPGHGRI